MALAMDSESGRPIGWLEVAYEISTGRLLEPQILTLEHNASSIHRVTLGKCFVANVPNFVLDF